MLGYGVGDGVAAIYRMTREERESDFTYLHPHPAVSRTLDGRLRGPPARAKGAVTIFSERARALSFEGI